MTTLAHRATRALIWSYLGVGAHIVFQIAANVGFARLLGPDAFGLFAIGLLVTGVLKIITDLGLGAAVARAQTLEQGALRDAFIRLLAGGLLGGATLAATAELIATLMDEPRLAAILRCFALAFLCFPVVTLCAGVLQQRLEHKKSQFASVVGYAFGYLGLGLTLASLGFGAWSPALGYMAQLLISASLLYYFARPDLTRGSSRTASSAALTSFGLRVVATNVSNWLIYNLDNFFVHLTFGTQRYGLYTVSYSLMRTPTDHLVQTIQNVLMPVASKVQHQDDKLARSYLGALDASFTLCAPACATVAAVAPTVVGALYGPDWASAAVLLSALSLAMALQAVHAVASATLWGIGAVNSELRIQWGIVVLLVAALLATTRLGLTVLAWSVCAVYAIRALLMLVTVSRHVPLTPARTLRALRTGILLAAAIAPAVHFFDGMLVAHGVHPLPALLYDLLAGTALWLIGIAITRGRTLSDELRSALNAAFASVRHSIPLFRRVS